MSEITRRYIPMAIVMLIGLMMLGDYYLVVPSYYHDRVTDIKNIAVSVVAFTVGVGTLSLLVQRAKVIKLRGKGWHYEIWTILVMILFLFFGVSFGTDSIQYEWIFMNIYTPIFATMFSLVGFFIVYASYKAFFVRNWESAVMLIVCIFTLIGNAPIGAWIWPGFTSIFSWLQNQVATAGITAFVICAAIGAISIGFRVLMGKEKAALG